MAKSPKVIIPQVPVHQFTVDGVIYTIAKDPGREISQVDMSELVKHKVKTEAELRKPRVKKNEALIATIDRVLSEKPKLAVMRRRTA